MTLSRLSSIYRTSSNTYCNILIGLFLWLFSHAVIAYDTKPALTMAVYAPHPETIQHDYDQLAHALNQHMADYQLIIRAMNAAQINQALAEQTVDILFTNPSIYHQLRTQYALISPIASAQINYQNQPINSMGAVFFQRNQQPEITQLAQLIDKRIAAPAIPDTTAYVLAAYELYKANINPHTLHWQSVDSNDSVIQQVLAGKADVGVVRTGVLEQWIAQRRINSKDIHIINNQQLSAYPLMLSSELVPEWPIYALAHVPDSAIKALTIALFSVDHHWSAASNLDLYGFTPAADYTALQHILTQLNIAPFNRTTTQYLYASWQHHRISILLIAFITLAGLILAFWNYRLRHQLQRAQQRLKLLSLVFDTHIEGIVITDEQRRIIDTNKAFETISGYCKEDVLGQDPRVLKSGKQPAEFYQHMWQQLNTQDFWQGEVLNRRKNGAIYPEHLTIYAIRDHLNRICNYIAIFSDISQQKAQQAKIERLLHYDALTGLPNRILLSDRIKQALISARHQQYYLAVAFIDLDGFKEINDQFGHAAGDTLLTELGRRFMAIMRTQCTIARLDNDEFIAVMAGLPNRESAYPLLDQLLAASSQPVAYQSHMLSVSASIGVDFYTPSDYDKDISEHDLIQQADQAMYLAKQQGKNQIWFFDQSHRHVDTTIQPRSLTTPPSPPSRNN